MTSANPSASAGLTPSPVASTTRSRRSRRAALVRLLDRRLRGHFAALAARALSTLIALGYGGLVVAVAIVGAGGSADVVVTRALFWLSWVGAGGVALAASAPERGTEAEAVRSLAAQRGFSLRDLAMARAVATARRVLRTAGIPAVCVAALALAVSGSFGLLWPRLLLVVGVGVYTLFLAIVVTLLVELSRALSARHTRATLALLVLVPHVLRVLWPHVPSVPALFGAALGQLARLGAQL